MSAKHAQKSSNYQAKSKRKKSDHAKAQSGGSNSTGMFLTPPETFQPLRLIEHEPESLVPDNTTLTLIEFFSLFWNDDILGQIVQATNPYADLKRQGKQDKWWICPLTVIELRKFLGITIMMGIIRLSNRSQYWRKGRLTGRLLRP